MADYQDSHIPTQGIRLQVREYPRKAEAVLFLHFSGGNLMMWQRVIPVFQEKYHLILVDLRDHGHSDKPQTGNNIDQMALDLVGILEVLKVDQVHVIGSSLGAEVGLSLAANHPKSVKSLVCDGALCSEFGPYGLWQGSEKEFRAYVEKQLEAIRSRPTDVFPSAQAFIEARKKIWLEYGMWNEHIEAFVEYDAHPLGDGAFTRSHGQLAGENYMRAYFDCRFEDYYRRVKCPVLMVTSDEEPENPLEKEATLKMSQLPANGQLVMVPGWQHPYGWMLDPDAMIEVVLEFLGKMSG